MSALNIYQRINAVQKEVKYIKKDSEVSTGRGSYRAVSHDNVVAELRPSMIEQGIIVIPSLVDDAWIEPRKKDSINWLYTAKYKIRFQNIDDPQDAITLKVSGHANDSGDKAPGKAQSYAVKSAMLKVFALETGVDDESRNFDPTDYTDDQKDTFDELVDGGQSFAYYCFMQSLPEEIRGGLYNSFKTEKTKKKERCRMLSNQGAEEAQNIADNIKQMIDADDPAVIEITDEMLPREKRVISGMLRDGDIKYLAKLSQGV